MATIDRETLKHAALSAASFSYSPYSHFRVGAALLCSDGTIVTGTNIENRSYGLTTCAERNAIAAAIGSGMNKIVAIAVCGLDSELPLPPCGACRQVLSEFAGPDTPVVMYGKSGGTVEKSLGELLPFDSLQELKKS